MRMPAALFSFYVAFAEASKTGSHSGLHISISQEALKTNKQTKTLQWQALRLRDLIGVYIYIYLKASQMILMGIWG